MSKIENSQSARLELKKIRSTFTGGISDFDILERWLPTPDEDSEKKIEIIEGLINLIGLKGKFRKRFTKFDVNRFVGAIAGMRNPDSIIDPVCGSGLMLRKVVSHTNPSTVHGFDMSRRATDFASRLFKNPNQECRIYDTNIHETAGSLMGLLPQYDLIIADPTFGERLKRPFLLPGLDERTNELELAVIIWSLSKLSPSGTGIFVISSECIETPNPTLDKAFNYYNFSVKACISLTNGSLPNTVNPNGWTDYDSYLIVVEKGCDEEVFVGQLSLEKDLQDLLFRNLARSKPGNQPSLGSIAHRKDFRGFPAFEAGENLKSLAVEMGLEKVEMKDLIYEHSKLSRHQLLSEDTADSFYLKSGIEYEFRAFYSPKECLADFPSQTDFIQVRVNTNLAEAEQVSVLFNHEMGRLFLKSLGLNYGDTDERVLDKIKAASFYLPPTQTQKRITALLNKIRAYSSSLNEIESVLLRNPKSVEEAEKRLATFSNEDSYKSWIDSLPAPLALILWRVHTRQDIAAENKVLIHFFEALAAFLATIYMSAAIRLNGFLDEIDYKTFYSKNSSSGLGFQNASFGLWVRHIEFFGKRLRQLLNNKASLCLDLFCTSNEEFLQMLTNKKLVGILQKANSLRNLGFGHGGATGVENDKETNGKLESLIRELRDLMRADAWSRYLLVRPVSCKIINDTFQNTVNLISGPESVG